jgi:glycosyltransferase involved in cell wall biosynthesis
LKGCSLNIVIVPSHNQATNISKIIRGYELQTIVPDLVLFVFDRCSDNSRQEFLRQRTKLNVRCLIKTEGSNFSAGMTRDFGVDYVVKNFPEYKNIIFTDGDCIPAEKLVELHIDCLSQSTIPAVSCGRRIMINKDGSESEDERIDNLWGNQYSFTNRNARLLLSNRVTLDSIFTYSCNLAFNKQSIELCKKINSIISNSDRVFNPEFDGSWGGEDNFISDCLFRTGNNILLTSVDCYVKHIWHEESQRIGLEIKKQILKKLSNSLKQLIVVGDIVGDYTVFEKNRNIGVPPGFYHQEANNLKRIRKDEITITNILTKLSYPIAHSDVDLFSKYILSRNRVIVNATENFSKKADDSNAIDILSDFLTFSKFYLVNDEIEYFQEQYIPKPVNNKCLIDQLINSSKRT